jgi:hypothetical protein
VETAASAEVLVADAGAGLWSQPEWQKRVENGGAVMVTLPRAAADPATAASKQALLPIRFLTVFWSLSWFPKQPGTLGTLCEPGHPALAGFPTEMQTDWQWFDLLEGSQAAILDQQPELQPIVTVIDDYHRSHKLAAVFEAKVGKARVLFTTLDLSGNLEARPAARQLRRSLLDYASSSAFQPKVELAMGLRELLLGR